MVAGAPAVGDPGPAAGPQRSEHDVLYVPLVTPLRADGELAADALETLAHSVIDAGAAGLVALGTTGEPATRTARSRLPNTVSPPSPSST